MMIKYHELYYLISRLNSYILKIFKKISWYFIFKIRVELKSRSPILCELMASIYFSVVEITFSEARVEKAKRLNHIHYLNE